jgi:hydrogenase maturation protease
MQPEGTLILGVGNPLCGDDAAGVRAAEMLAGRELPAGVRVEEAGTPGWGLANWLEGCRRAILVDAAQMGLPPGSWRRFSTQEVKLIMSGEALSLHQPGLAEGLALAEAVGQLPEEIVIYGVEPAGYEWGQGLSPAVEAALPGLADAILHEAEKHNL